MGKESEKSLKESLDLVGIDWISVDFSQRNMWKGNWILKEEKPESQHVIFGKSPIFMKKETQKHPKVSSKSRYSHGHSHDLEMATPFLHNKRQMLRWSRHEISSYCRVVSEKGEASNTVILLVPKWHAGPAISCYNSRGNLWGYGPCLNLSFRRYSKGFQSTPIVENEWTSSDFRPFLKKSSHPDMEHFSLKQLPPSFTWVIKCPNWTSPNH